MKIHVPRYARDVHLSDPPVPLLDKPTRSLDPLAASDFGHLLKNELVRGRGTALLFGSHTLAEDEEIADPVVLLDAGIMLACDSPRGLCASAGAPTLEQAILRFARP
jgi:ABC-type multidrug transport system ATPase subunit